MLRTETVAVYCGRLRLYREINVVYCKRLTLQRKTDAFDCERLVLHTEIVDVYNVA
jgi:hypothetical protein